MEDVQAVDADKKHLHTQFGVVPYDYLVIATGALHSYFGHDDWSDYAPGLKRIEDATRIRRTILIAFEQAEVIQDQDEQRRLLTFVIVGGGATGVEMAGAIADVARETLAADFRRIDPRSARIVLIEAGPRLLPTFPQGLSDYAHDTLTRAGVEVKTGTLVTKCDARGVDLKDGRIDAATVIWAAGVMASPVARWLNVEADRAGRVKVAPDLSVPAHPEIFVIGDAASVSDAQGHQVPGIAPAAKQMGKYVGKLISSRIAGRATPKPFHYLHLGDLATIGRRVAVVKFGRLELRGFIGWVFWSLAHIYFLIGLRNRFVVAFNWFWDYITFQRGARLITEVPQGSGRDAELGRRSTQQETQVGNGPAASTPFGTPPTNR
jgi:NADH dehydrogenase